MYHKKRVIVWSVFILAAAALVLALIFVIRGTFRENDLHTQSVEEFTLSPVKEAYSGKEEILGTTIELPVGEEDKVSLKFPAVISEYHPEKAYILTNITNAAYDFKKGAAEMQENAPKLFKAFYGDKYDESCCSFVELNELETYIIENYNGKNGETAWLGASGYSLIKDQSVFDKRSQKAVTIDTYFFKDHPDKTVELPDGQITLTAAAERFAELFKTTLSDFTFGYEIRPCKAVISECGGDKALRIVGEQLYFGIPFESCGSTFIQSKGDEMTSYGFSYADAEMTSVKDFFLVSNQMNPIIARSEPLDKIIPLKGAVEILKKNLARNTDYTFSDIKLMYCCKHTQQNINVNDEDREKLKKLIAEENTREDVYRPTWYFIIKEESDSTCGIKVDAVSGEITMDIL